MGSLTFEAPRPLREHDSVEGFCCGNDFVDLWVFNHARYARSAGTAVVYGTFCDARLAGFYTLSAQSLDREITRGWLARNTPASIPVILLGMLGVDKEYQGCGLGHDLLLDATRRTRAVSQEIGAKALVVDPFDDQASRFYERYGFRRIPESMRMYAKL